MISLEDCIGLCGLTEEEVRTRGIPYEVGIARFRETSRGHIMGVEQGMLKMIFSIKTRRLLGVHIVGETIVADESTSKQ